MTYITTPLSSKHDRSNFSCGQESLDHYIKKQASQDMKRRLSVVFVQSEENSNRVKGYYSLSNDNIPRNVAPNNILKKMPLSYTDLPVTLLGRLAIDTDFQGQ